MSSEDPIKESFQKVKHDIYSLYSEISSLKRDLAATRQEMSKMSEILTQLSRIAENMPKTTISTHPATQQINPTNQQENQTVPTHNPSYFPQFNKGIQGFSIGNEGVPTDRQTDQQTDNTPPNKPFFVQNLLKTQENNKRNIQNPIEDAARALDSLDGLKKEIRLKFKQLTDQEILVFSALYQMEEEGQAGIDYKTLALKLSLTESSIRDYIGRLLQKGIPIEKHKVNNKKILLSISQSLKRVASLATILQLRDL